MRLGLSNRRIIPYKKYKSCSRLSIFISFVLAIVFSFIFVARLRPVLLRLFTPYAVNVGSDAINFTVADYFQKTDYDYYDFVTLSYNSENKITSVQTNSPLMNKIKAELSIYLQEEIMKLKTTQISVPLGSIFNNIIFHGMGPKVKIKISPTDITDLNFNDTFEDVGINQVRHKIYIDAYISVSINCASMTKTEVIHDTIPVAETVIVGDVPLYYAENGDLQVLPE